MKITLLGTGDAVGTPKIGFSCKACLDALAGGKKQEASFFSSHRIARRQSTN